MSKVDEVVNKVHQELNKTKPDLVKRLIREARILKREKNLFYIYPDEDMDELVDEAAKAINQLRKENKALRFSSYIAKSALSTVKTQNMLMIDMLTDLVENWERLTDGDLSRIKDTLDEVLS